MTHFNKKEIIITHPNLLRFQMMSFIKDYLKVKEFEVYKIYKVSKS